MLAGEKISHKGYEHADTVCDTFETQIMKDYHHLYLKLNVLLLADVFEKFRNSSLTNYGLYPGHYLGAPALSWNVMLNMSKIELEFISDADMYFFFVRGMKDGVSYVSKRYGKANNKY